MFNQSNQFDRLVLVSVTALLLGTTLVPDARGWQGPATPCACEADSVCQPKGPWGHTQTKWRPWPGDKLGPAPTSVEETKTREQLQLDPFELPPVVKEGLRGQNITKPRRVKRDDDAAEAAEDNVVKPVVPQPAVIQPEVEPLEEIDLGPFGAQDIFDLDPPAEKQPQLEADPLPDFDFEEDKKEEAEPVVEPLDDFDPFSRIDRRRGVPASTNRRTSLAPPVNNDAPPQLPPSLLKLSRRSPPNRQAPLRDSRFQRPALAMVQ